ncbi:MAG: hypothetical protein ACE5KE_12730, partial [Methanosarcinales archaeon]
NVILPEIPQKEIPIDKVYNEREKYRNANIILILGIIFIIVGIPALIFGIKTKKDVDTKIAKKIKEAKKKHLRDLQDIYTKVDMAFKNHSECSNLLNIIQEEKINPLKKETKKKTEKKKPTRRTRRR